MNDQRTAFEEAVNGDLKWDMATHMAYADWLMEHDEPELSEKHRLWTPEWQEAEDYFIRFAKAATEENYDTGEMVVPSLEQIIEAATNKVDHGRHGVIGYSGYTAERLIESEEDRKEFWDNWEKYTRRKVGDKVKIAWGDEEEDLDTPFTCCTPN